MQVVQRLVTIAGPIYDSLDTNLRMSLHKFFTGFVNRYYAELSSIHNSIESGQLPDVSNLVYRFRAYESVLKITQIEPLFNEIETVQHAISVSSTKHFNAIMDQTEEMNKRFVAGKKLGNSEVETLVEYINYFFALQRLISKNKSFGFEKVQELSTNDLDNLKNHQTFYLGMLTVQQDVSDNLFSDALQKSHAAINYAYKDSLYDELIRRINLNGSNAVDFFNYLFETDDLGAIRSLLTLPTNYFTKISRDKLLNNLDILVVKVWQNVRDNTDNKNYDTALEKLSNLNKLPNYSSSYKADHEVTKLYILDSYAYDTFEKATMSADQGKYYDAFETLANISLISADSQRYKSDYETTKMYVLDGYAKDLFNNVRYHLEHNEFGLAISELSNAEKVSGYLDRYAETQAEVLQNVRDLRDEYWLLKIVSTVEQDSISAGLSVINGKLHASVAKFSATSNMVDYIDYNKDNLIKNLGFEKFVSDLRLINVNDTLSDDSKFILEKILGHTFKSWISDAIKNADLYGAVKLIYGTDNGLSNDIRNDLLYDLIKSTDSLADENPGTMINFLSMAKSLRYIPLEIRDKFLTLEFDIMSRWSSRVAKNGINSCADFSALRFGLQASSDYGPILNPPLTGPSEKGKFYNWSCRITAVSSPSRFACATGFSFFLVDGVKQTFPDQLQENRRYSIIGEYTRNFRTNNLKLIPVLENTYVALCE